MVLLKSFNTLVAPESTHDLHSNMVLLKYNRTIWVVCGIVIYIPIWYYLNLPISDVHYGKKCDLHSNMVLLKYKVRDFQQLRTIYLHSNMVLLK